MGRIRAVVGLSLVCVGLALVPAGCGRSGNDRSGNAQSASGSGQATANSDLDAEKTQALDDPAFTAPIVLHVGSDDMDMINRVVAQGSTPYQFESLAPARPCQEMNNGSLPMVARYQGDDSGSLDRSVTNWLTSSGFIEVSAHSISYVAPSGGIESENFNCFRFSDKVLRYMPNPASDIHHGFDLPILKRTCSAWTYANAYETDAPGKGKVRVFAGTFTFTTVPLMPGLATGGTGTYQVKMYLDPDTGNWQRQSQQVSDNTTITWNAVPADAAPITPPSGASCPGP